MEREEEELRGEEEGDVPEPDMDEEEEEEEEDDDDNGEDEEEEDDDEGYKLQFDGDIDPLGLAQENTQGIELYRQFERLEYEALAERKRKALADQQTRNELPLKKRKHDEFVGASMEEIDELMNFASRRRRRRSRDPKKRGRKKGSRKKLNPEISRKIGDATLFYASENYSEAIPVLEEVVRLAPNLPDSYCMLGVIYEAMGERKKAMNFHMIAAHLTPKDPSIWRKLIDWSIEQGNTGQVRYCLSKAITADPEDVGLKFRRALLHSELREYQKAADIYDQIVGLYPANTEACLMAAKMYDRCGRVDRAIKVLEDYINGHSSEANPSVVSFLISLHMEANTHIKAVYQIEQAIVVYGSQKKLPLCLKGKAAICHAYLGHMENAEAFLNDILLEHVENNGDLITEVADSLVNLGHYDYALKFYFTLEKKAEHDRGILHLKIAQCYSFKKEREKAIPFFYKALSVMDDNIDARITLSTLLVEEGREEEAISLLHLPKTAEKITDPNSASQRPWWFNSKVQIQLAKIYHAKGMLQDFTDAIFPGIRETLIIESMKRKKEAKKKKCLTRTVLSERVKLLDNKQPDNVFHGFKPIATTSDLIKASRAKKSLQKKEALREEKKAAALAAGLDWLSEDSEDDTRIEIQEPPLPRLLEDGDHHQLILDLCNSLKALQRYWDAFEIIYHTLRLASNRMPVEKKEELRSLGAQIAYKTRDPKHGYQYARYIVEQNPNSISAWNCYYMVILRFENPDSRHFKFINHVLTKRGDLIPPLLIHGHQLSLHSWHQSAARNYLEAYKLQPDNPLINLCVGTAMVNMALGFRLQNKHQCTTQGFAFLYNNLRLCHNSQEALYNIARAFHHVGLVTLAALYYEKVLKIHVNDYPIPKLPNEDLSVPENQKPGYCSLHREAAYNLHLIYKKSGAVDLARQVLKDYCNP